MVALGCWGLQEYYGRTGEDGSARERAHGQPRRQPCSASMADPARGSNPGEEERGFEPELTRNSVEVVARAGVAQRRRN